MSRAERATLLAASLGSAMLLLDVTIVYVALPTIGRDLNAPFSEIQWVVDAYTVVLAATMISVLPVERSGMPSGVNNTFRHLGIAMGVGGCSAGRRGRCLADAWQTSCD